MRSGFFVPVKFEMSIMYTYGDTALESNEENGLGLGRCIWGSQHVGSNERMRLEETIGGVSADRGRPGPRAEPGSSERALD